MRVTKTVAGILTAIILLIIVILAVFYYNRAEQAKLADSTPATGVEFIMNTVVEFKLYGENAPAAITAIKEELHSLEAQLSLYRAGSAIRELSEKSGREPVSFSPEAFALLKRAKEFGALSGGVFDITIAPVVQEWDITGENPHIPPQGRILSLLELVDYRDLILDEENHTAMLAREGQAVDLGAIAKGGAADIVRRAALEAGVESGFVSIGGNIIAIGRKPDGSKLRFGVRDPRGEQSSFFAIVELEDTTMSTSGDYERYFEENAVRYHHIFDTSTGYPAISDLMSVSVIAQDGALAEYLSTTLFIRGKETVLGHLNEAEYQIIAVDLQGNVYYSPSLEQTMEKSGNSGDYKFIKQAG